VTGTLLVRFANASVVPAYGLLRVDASPAVQQSDIGEGGEFYFDRLAAGIHRAQVEFAGGRCSFDLTVPQTTQSFVRLGKVVCQNGVRS